MEERGKEERWGEKRGRKESKIGWIEEKKREGMKKTGGRETGVKERDIERSVRCVSARSPIDSFHAVSRNVANFNRPNGN